MISKWKNVTTALALVLAIGIGIGAGYAIWGGSPQIVYVPQSPPSSGGSEPTTLPQHHTLSFTVEPSGRYSFPIYLSTDWTLHITWWTDEGAPDVGFGEVVFGFIAPCGDFYGYTSSPSPISWQEGLTRSGPEGKAVLDFSEYEGLEGYQFDDGYYEFVALGAAIKTHWHVHYWIED